MSEKGRTCHSMNIKTAFLQRKDSFASGINAGQFHRSNITAFVVGDNDNYVSISWQSHRIKRVAEFFCYFSSFFFSPPTELFSISLVFARKMLSFLFFFFDLKQQGGYNNSQNYCSEAAALDQTE